MPVSRASGSRAASLVLEAAVAGRASDGDGGDGVVATVWVVGSGSSSGVRPSLAGLAHDNAVNAQSQRRSTD